MIKRLSLLILIPLILHAQPKLLKVDPLTKEAEVIVVGKVGKLSSEWNKDKIETQVSVSVGQTIKGNFSEKTIVVVVPGGERDGVGEWYSHTARFNPDEDVVLFAKRDNTGKYIVAGGERGKILVKKDSKGQKMIPNFGTLDEFTTAIKKSLKATDNGAKQ